MSSNEIFPVPASWQGRAWIDEAGYRREYERSLRDPAGFWTEHAARLERVRYRPEHQAYRDGEKDRRDDHLPRLQRDQRRQRAHEADGEL